MIVYVMLAVIFWFVFYVTCFSIGFGKHFLFLFHARAMIVKNVRAAADAKFVRTRKLRETTVRFAPPKTSESPHYDE